MRAAVVTMMMVVTGAAAAADVARAAPCVVVTGARVALPGGKVADPGAVEVTIEGGFIAAVGAPAGARTACTRVDGAGRMLTPGLVDAYTGLGLVEIDLEAGTVDTDLKAPPGDGMLGVVRAAVRPSLAYNPRSVPIQVARMGGVTSALVVPTGGIISGAMIWADLAGSGREMLREPIGMAASLGGAESRAASLHVIDIALREATSWPNDKQAWERGARADFLNRTLDLEALGPVVRGEIPLVVRADRASDLRALVSLQALHPKLRLVIVGGAEAWLEAELLAKARVPVIVNGLQNAPSDFDSLQARADNAARLDAAGVPVCLSVFDTHLVRKLRQVAGNVVRAGMRWESALMAVTERPADAFGLATHGRIAVGSPASLVLWSGDPFELSTQVERVWIAGREVSLRSRQTELFERWRTLP